MHIGIGLGLLQGASGARHDFSDVASGPTLDLDPDTLAAGLVATFNNSGSAGGSFTAAGGARPTCQAGPNGHKEVDADGAANVMGTALVGSNILSAAAYTMFAVVKIDAIDTNAAASYDNDAVLAFGGEFAALSLNSVPQFQAFHWDGAEKKDAVSTATGSYLLLQQRYDGTKIYARSGSAAEGGGAAAGSISNLTQTLSLFRNYTTAFFDGKLVRLLAFNTSLSAGDLTIVRARLAALYTISV